ncbi:MAG: translation initiation factor [Alphaproteobacteria bacterium]|nr:translation initiation factor [Alphaproteobacteria bacterium]
MARKDKDVVQTGGGSSLGDLFGALGVKASAPAASPAPTPAPAAAVPVPGAPDLSGKVVLRRSKKGRGGKTATLVQGVGGGPVALDTLAKTLRKQLGCGSSVDGDDVVVQGDQVDRVAAALEAMGARRLVRG